MCPAKKVIVVGFGNKVDLLRKEINEIQEKCEHKFFLLERFKPKDTKDTLEKSVFRAERVVIAGCLDCSKEVEIDMTEMCPRCFGKMISQKKSEGSAYQIHCSLSGRIIGVN